MSNSTSKYTVRAKVPFFEKLAFGSGHLVNNLLPGALGVFMFFLLTAFGMDPWMAGLLGGLPRIFDALTDPIMGYISDHAQTRWGRRKPFIFLGALLSGGLFALLWQMDAANGPEYNFWYFLILSLVYLVGNTIFSTPLIALGYEMTDDYDERTNLMGFSQIMGQIAWMVVPWFWVLIADPDLFADQATGVRQLAIYVGIGCGILGILPAIFCKEANAPTAKEREPFRWSGIFDGLKDLLNGIVETSKNKPFMRLCGATFLVFNGFQLVASFSYFIIVFYMFRGDFGEAGQWPAWFSTISAVATAFLVIPVVTWMSNKMGKRKAFIWATAISLVGYLLKWWGFNPDNPWLIFMPIPLLSFGIGGLFTLMMSMTADVVDLEELKNGRPRKEGTFGAIYWWMVKFGQAIALVLGGAVLSWVGFDQNEATQPMEVLTNLRLADIIIPAGTAALAIWVMWGYDLDRKRMEEIKEELVERRGKLDDAEPATN